MSDTTSIYEMTDEELKRHLAWLYTHIPSRNALGFEGFCRQLKEAEMEQASREGLVLA